MTTKVTVDPASHTIEITITEGETKIVETMAAGTPPRDYWVYGDRAITVQERE